MPEFYEKKELRDIMGGTLRPGGLELTRRGIELCGWRPGDRVLDLGCGPGESLGLMRALGLEAWGLDKSEKLLREAARRGPVIKADMAGIPLADAALDGAAAECVLSLMPDKAAVLKEVRRVLAPGGRLLLSDLFLKRAAETPEDPAPPRTAGAETLPRWQELLQEAGFKVLHCLDESECLVQLAVNMIFKYGSTAEFFRHWGPDGGTCRNGAANGSGRGVGKNLGYALVIAEAAD